MIFTFLSVRFCGAHTSTQLCNDPPGTAFTPLSSRSPVTDHPDPLRGVGGGDLPSSYAQDTSHCLPPPPKAAWSFLPSAPATSMSLCVGQKWRSGFLVCSGTFREGTDRPGPLLPPKEPHSSCEHRWGPSSPLAPHPRTTQLYLSHPPSPSSRREPVPPEAQNLQPGYERSSCFLSC